MISKDQALQNNTAVVMNRTCKSSLGITCAYSQCVLQSAVSEMSEQLNCKGVGKGVDKPPRLASLKNIVPSPTNNSNV